MAEKFSTFLLFLQVAIVAVIAYFVYQFINAGKAGAAKISKAADKANETAGYETSEGQTDPLVLYNQARQAYATAHGYAAGTDNFRNPPGFPTFDAWQSTNAAQEAESPGYLKSWWNSFETAL